MTSFSIFGLTKEKKRETLVDSSSCTPNCTAHVIRAVRVVQILFTFTWLRSYTYKFSGPERFVEAATLLSLSGWSLYSCFFLRDEV